MLMAYVCLASTISAKTINFKERQEWLTQYIKENTDPNAKWGAAIGVSGEKICTIKHMCRR